MRNNPLDLKPTKAQEEALADIIALKAAGEGINTPKEAINRAVMVITKTISALLHGIESGVAGEPTGEDLQRLHELRALLDDLP